MLQFSPDLLFGEVKLVFLRRLRPNLKLLKKHHINVVGLQLDHGSDKSTANNQITTNKTFIVRHVSGTVAYMGTICGRCCNVTFSNA